MLEYERSEPTSRRTRIIISSLILAVVLMLILATGTAAFLIDRSDRVENVFLPAEVSCEAEEEFDGELKRNVSVSNTGDITVYMRLKLVTYRINDRNEKIGGTAELPEFIPGDGWFLRDGIYYYSLPVLPGHEPEAPLIGNEGIKLTKYTDADGGKQTVEVIAEVIQAEPSQAVQDAWGVTVSADGRIAQ